MENLRRRTARDVHDARVYAIANFARDMLGVSDDLNRALAAIPAEAKASGDQAKMAQLAEETLTELSVAMEELRAILLELGEDEKALEEAGVLP